MPTETTPNTTANETPSSDVLAIGQCTADLFMQIKGGSVETEENGAKVCFYHGSKVVVEKFDMMPGGNPLNVAVGLRKQGIKTAVYSEIGDDNNADDIVTTLKEAGADTSMCHKNKGSHTNVSTIISYMGDRTIFGYHHDQTFKIQDWGTPEIIYFSSMPNGYEGFHKELIEWVEKNPETMLVFNPGTLHFKNGVETFSDILKVADVLIVNQEEAEQITKMGSGRGGDTQKNVDEEYLEKLHTGLQKLGPKLTAITLGKDGASAYAGGKLERSEVHHPEGKALVDRTGAGDAFSSGFVGALFYKKPLKEALRWGIVNSGHVITEIGAIHGVLTKEEISSK
jgi:sugar/nucleoside kinase (ribokinase family)